MTTDALASGPAVRDREPHRLAGRLGPAAIVFMVVAAAAPLTVVAGTFPIGIAAGNGLGRHMGLGAAFLALLSYTAVQGGVYGYVGAAIGELVTSHGGPSVPWYV